MVVTTKTHHFYIDKMFLPFLKKHYPTVYLCDGFIFQHYKYLFGS